MLATPEHMQTPGSLGAEPYGTCESSARVGESSTGQTRIFWTPRLPPAHAGCVTCVRPTALSGRRGQGGAGSFWPCTAVQGSPRRQNKAPSTALGWSLSSAMDHRPPTPMGPSPSTGIKVDTQQGVGAGSFSPGRWGCQAGQASPQGLDVH